MKMSCKEANKKWSQKFGRDEILFISRLKDKGLDDVDIFNIIEVFENICLHCFDYDRGCQCWNDE